MRGGLCPLPGVSGARRAAPLGKSMVKPVGLSLMTAPLSPGLRTGRRRHINGGARGGSELQRFQERGVIAHLGLQAVRHGFHRGGRSLFIQRHHAPEFESPRTVPVDG